LFLNSNAFASISGKWQGHSHFGHFEMPLHAVILLGSNSVSQRGKRQFHSPLYRDAVLQPRRLEEASIAPD